MNLKKAKKLRKMTGFKPAEERTYVPSKKNLKAKPAPRENHPESKRALYQRIKRQKLLKI